MATRYRNNIIATIGLACGAVLSLFSVLTLWWSGPSADQAGSVFGIAIVHAANAFSAPATATSAGSDRADLVDALHLYVAAPLMLLLPALFWRCTRSARTRKASPLLLVAQLVIAALVEPLFLFLFAAELALIMPMRKSLKWLAALIVLVLVERLSAAILDGLQDNGVLRRLFILCIEIGFYFLAFGISGVAVLEQRARTGLLAANAELKATQVLLADTVRATERLRIARDLHDHVGHHLTALNLHLDLAQRQASGKLLELLDISRELSNALLAEVRRVVGQERDDRPIDLAQALQALCSGIPQPAIRLTIDEPLSIDSAATAHTVFRCVQEGLSNAIRHAEATLITIRLHRRDGELVARVSDDGRGNAGRAEGNGLRGMRERLEAIDGTLVAANQSPGGYAIEIRLPLRAAQE